MKHFPVNAKLQKYIFKSPCGKQVEFSSANVGFLLVPLNKRYVKGRMTNWDRTWHIIITPYLCLVEFCKRLRMTHSPKFCKLCLRDCYCTLISHGAPLRKPVLLELWHLRQGGLPSYLNAIDIHRNQGFTLKSMYSCLCHWSRLIKFLFFDFLYSEQTLLTQTLSEII